MKKKFQVFISSTYTDLIEERQQAVTAVLDSNHIPAGMELFKANNQDQMKVIRQWIDESDVFMLILGGRYGSLDPATQKSYTHLEYEYALEKKMPIFTLILTDKMIKDKYSQSNRPMEDFREVKNVKKHAAFVKQTKTGSVVRYLDSIYQIDAIVMGSLSLFENNPEIGGWVRSEQYSHENIDIADLQSQLTKLKEENLALKKLNTAKNFLRKPKNNPPGEILSIMKEASQTPLSLNYLITDLGFDSKRISMLDFFCHPKIKNTFKHRLDSRDRSSNYIDFIFTHAIPFLEEHDLVTGNELSDVVMLGGEKHSMPFTTYQLNLRGNSFFHHLI